MLTELPLSPALHSLISRSEFSRGVISLDQADPVFLNSACDHRSAQLENCRVLLECSYRQFVGWNEKLKLTNSFINEQMAMPQK